MIFFSIFYVLFLIHDVLELLGWVYHREVSEVCAQNPVCKELRKSFVGLRQNAFASICFLES